MKKRALFSVSDKIGITEFAKAIAAQDYEIISTGGTAETLQAAGIAVINVSDVTKFPECLDGRLKTLHPAIHGGILAMRSNPDHMAQIELLDIAPIDIVVINLYPFKETILKPGVTLEKAIENIDIGGPAMLRAGAKNWQDVAVITDPADYESIAAELSGGNISSDTKFKLAAKVFAHTAQYDTLIAGYLNNLTGEKFPPSLTLTYEKCSDMRYGENPHQAAAFYREPLVNTGIAAAKQLSGKELSFNNINDANAAMNLLFEFTEPCAVAVKHANPCGVGIGADICEAYRRAYNADSVSIFGGIAALNRECDAETAEELGKIFLEIVIAPSFTSEALSILTRKKNLRILEMPETGQNPGFDLKKVGGGLLLQEADLTLGMENFTVATKRAPTEKELAALKFAWRVVKHTRSNGIVLSNDIETVGIGPGQTNRITALELAIRYGGEKVRGSVMGSDAFFPFRDCVDAAAAAGVTAIIQPGGSVNDAESIAACDEHNIAMLFTGIRHFKH